MRWAPPFDPEVAYLYNAGTAISVGEGVQWNGSTATEFADPQPSTEQRMALASQSTRSTGVTLAVPTIKQATTIATGNSMCGVAMEDIAAAKWGRVALWGLVDIRLGPSTNITVGDLLVVSAAGMFAETPGIATATQVHAMAMEATITSGTCAAALIQAFIGPGHVPGDDCMGGATTA